MAHYSFRRNKDGAITSVRICIHTDNGQINTSYKPEFDDMPEDYIMLKARSYGDAMEGNIKFGTYLSPSTLFSDAAEYFIALGRSFGNTAKTERYYRTLLVRVKDPVYGFGNMPIGKITTGTINTFIMNLSQSENKHSPCVRCTVDIDKFLKNHHISVYSFAKKAGTSEDVIRRIRKGKNITLTSAEKICSVYGNNLESMFILTDPGKLSTTFLNDHINFIRSVFSLAVREHVIFFNPCDPVRRFKSSTTKKTGALSMDQIKRIFVCLKEEDNLEMVLFTFLLIFTGARRGEILGLK